MPNVDLAPVRLSAWRKIALGTWRSVGDPSVYGTLEIDATRILARQRRWGERTSGKPPGLTAIVTRATALVLAAHPGLNGIIRWGRIYRRRTVTLFLQAAVDEAGEELSGITLREVERKSLVQIAEEVAAQGRAIRSGADPHFARTKAMFGRVPAFLVRWVLNTISFLLYTLNLDLSWLGLPKDAFGSAMITNVGTLGLDAGFAPLVPYSRVPLLLAIGVVRDQPCAHNGQVVVSPILPIYATFDHRFIDGVHVAKMVKTMRHLLETDEGLTEVGLI